MLGSEPGGMPPQYRQILFSTCICRSRIKKLFFTGLGLGLGFHGRAGGEL